MSEITIKQGHLKPASTREVVIEDGDWEVSVWVHGGKVEIVVVNREDKTIRLTDTDTGDRLDIGSNRTEVALRVHSGR